MKTTVSILVKNENLFTKACSSLLWFIKIFQKSKVLVSINGGEAKALSASKKFYEFEVEPGQVTLEFYDPCAGGKAFFRKMVCLFSLGLFNIIDGFFDDVHEKILECTLQEGDNLKVSCKSKFSGNVKVKVLKG